MEFKQNFRAGKTKNSLYYFVDKVILPGRTDVFWTWRVVEAHTKIERSTDNTYEYNMNHKTLAYSFFLYISMSPFNFHDLLYHNVRIQNSLEEGLQKQQ